MPNGVKSYSTKAVGNLNVTSTGDYPYFFYSYQTKVRLKTAVD